MYSVVTPGIKRFGLVFGGLGFFGFCFVSIAGLKQKHVVFSKRTVLPSAINTTVLACFLYGVSPCVYST